MSLTLPTKFSNQIEILDWYDGPLMWITEDLDYHDRWICIVAEQDNWIYIAKWSQELDDALTENGHQKDLSKVRSYDQVLLDFGDAFLVQIDNDHNVINQGPYDKFG